jgi:hypothetical protein
MELAHYRVKWRTAVLAVLNLRVLLPERSLISKMDLKEIGWEVDGTGSGSCPMADFGISGVEPSGSATREVVN